jgi:threonine aldolase
MDNDASCAVNAIKSIVGHSTAPIGALDSLCFCKTTNGSVIVDSLLSFGDSSRWLGEAHFAPFRLL